jgi:hypothetical protein
MFWKFAWLHHRLRLNAFSHLWTIGNYITEWSVIARNGLYPWMGLSPLDSAADASQPKIRF